MKSRPAATVLLLATAAPILVYTAMGLTAWSTGFSVASVLITGLIFGGILAGVALITVGAFFSRRGLTLVGAALLSAESIPLLVDGFFVFTLLPAAMSFLLLGVRGRDSPAARRMS